MLRILIAVFIFIFTSSAFAALDFPQNLNASERKTALSILGFGTASKLLSSPYPLGGFHGVEVGMTSEYIPLADLAGLGTKSNSKTDLNYFNLMLGKGLFYNLDLFVHFIPMPQDESVSGYGAQLRWGFYETKFMPAALSLVVHGSGTNINNLLGAETTGVDLVGSVNMRDVSLFFGIGQARSVGTFVGGADGVTDTGNTESADVYSPHTMFGISIKMASVFIALEVDRYVQSTYAGKLGVRF
ncbi:hypothetical protein [Bdellovibrio sp. HCB337]|uniref:hypothetical protein n=1 Tax=Bdellovibrio sp. HCB337 TaxID=3394358 RepID=UPI0039A6866C